MSETKWPKGPWRLLERFDPKPVEWEAMQIVCHDVGQHGNMDVAAEWTKFVDEEQRNATAHLIAAAPDLYEALAELLLASDALGEGVHAEAPYREAANRAASILAKARGEDNP